MKKLFKCVAHVILFSMVLFILKPALSHSIEQQTQNKTQYSTTSSPCPSRTAVVTACSSWLYTLTEEGIGIDAFLFLLSGILFYRIININYHSPIASLFKPPISI